MLVPGGGGSARVAQCLCDVSLSRLDCGPRVDTACMQMSKLAMLIRTMWLDARMVAIWRTRRPHAFWAANSASVGGVSVSESCGSSFTIKLGQHTSCIETALTQELAQIGAVPMVSKHEAVRSSSHVDVSKERAEATCRSIQALPSDAAAAVPYEPWKAPNAMWAGRCGPAFLNLVFDAPQW